MSKQQSQGDKKPNTSYPNTDRDYFEKGQVPVTRNPPAPKRPKSK